MLASGIGTALQYSGQKKQLERDELRNRNLMSKSAAEAAKRQEAIEGSFGVDKYTLQALEQARSKQGVKELQDQQNISSANQLELAARLGARGGANALASERSRAAAVVDAANKQRQAEMSALESTGKVKRDMESLKRGWNQSMYRMSEADRRAAREGMLSAKDSQAALKTNLATGILSAATPMLGAIGSGNFNEQMFGNMFGGGTDAAAGSGSGFGSGSYGNIGGSLTGGLSSSGGYQFPAGGFSGWSGEKGMKTPGEFSHESNPINLMQNGAKVGEVTGGEYVVNPSQAKKIAEQSAYARMLFKKFDNKA